MPRYLALAESDNPYQLSESGFDLSNSDYELMQNQPDMRNYIFFPGDGGDGGEYHHIKRFADMPDGQFNQMIDELAPFQPAMNENQYMLSEDGSVYELPGLSAPAWKAEKKQQKQEQKAAKKQGKVEGKQLKKDTKVANKQASVAIKQSKADLRTAKADGIRGGTYAPPDVLGGITKGAKDLFSNVIPKFSGSVSAEIVSPQDLPKPSIIESLVSTWQSIPLLVKVGIAGTAVFIGYKIVTKKKKASKKKAS